MSEWVITVPIEPVPKGRPRAFRMGNHVRMHTPKRTRDYEKKIAYLASQELPEKIFEGPLRLDVIAIIRRPKRLMRKKDPDGLIVHTQRPDVDNLRKAVMDGLKRHWRDDSQICQGQTWKFFAERDGLPRLIVRLTTEVDQEAPGWSDVSNALGLRSEAGSVEVDR